MFNLIGRMKIWQKMASSSMIILLLASVFIFAYYPHAQRVAAIQSRQERDLAVTRMLAQSIGLALYSADYAALQHSLAQVKADDCSAFVQVLDTNGETIAKFDPYSFGDLPETESGSVFLAAGSPVPLNLTREHISYRGQDYGTVVLATSLDKVYQAIRHNNRNTACIILLIMGVGLALTLVQSKLITRPLQALGAAVQQFSAGDDASHIPDGGQDEVGKLAEAFADMATRLRNVMADLEHMAETAAESNKAKSAFLANMSHDIRTPMNGVLGMAELLATTDLTVDQQEMLTVIRYSGKSLLTLINDILDFSKIEAGQMDLVTEAFDLTELLENSLTALAITAQEHHVEFVVQLDPAVPTGLLGDPARLRQILVNLTGNAVKFTSQGEVTVAVSLLAVTDQGASIRFAVRDTGIGIAPDQHEKLFDAFVQADSSANRQFGGTGLGLSICRQLTELMGGEIGLDSTLGHGSTFWFTVDLALDQAAQECIQPGLDLGGAPVLVIDDSHASAAMLAAEISRHGGQSQRAGDPKTGLRLLLEAAAAGNPTPVAFVDLDLAGSDGAELCRHIAEDSNLAATSTVLMVPEAQRREIQDLRRRGITNIITKPVRRDRLQESLRIVLGLEQPESHTPTTEAIPAGPPVAPSAAIRLLLVEDNPINRKVALMMLGRAGYVADSADDGVEAIRALESTTYDLVLMDCQMPRMDGMAATRIIRDPSSGVLDHQVPIIALTANAMAETERECRDAGMDGFITKPMESKQLNAWIERLLSERGQLPTASSFA